MKKSVLSIKDLQKSYRPEHMILKGLNTEIYEGEFIVVIGPSGAGKSTFIRCLNRMVDFKGEVIFDGACLSKLKGKELRKARSKIGMIFQHYNLIGRTNVIKNVLHGRLGKSSFFKSALGLYLKEEKKDAYDLLKHIGLEEHIYKKAKELSGGQMQRVGICRAMMQRPRLLLADEPIASLDPKSAKTVMEQIHQITRKNHLTCIMNLHQVDIAKKYATRIIAIKGGQIVYDGQPENLSEGVVNFIYGKEEEITLPTQVELHGGLTYGI